MLIPLVEALQAEEKVVEARYYLGHPFLERPSLYLKTKGEKPQQVLKRVLKGPGGLLRGTPLRLR